MEGFRDSVQGGSSGFQKSYQLLCSDITSQELNFLIHNQLQNPRQPHVLPSFRYTMPGGLEHHYMALFFQGSLSEVQNP